MIKISLTVALAVTTFASYAQEYKTAIKEQFLKYSTLLIEKKFEASMEYLNPSFFTLISKDQLVKVMEQTYNNPGIEFEIGQPDVGSIQDKQKINGMDYVKFRYTNLLKIRLKPQEGRTIDTSATKKRLQTQFGENNVTYDSKSGFYQALVHKNVVANSSDDLAWTFIVVEDRQKQMLEKILPKELLQ